MWLYKSSVGLMRIFLNSNNRYTLEISGERYGFYHSPVTAADDVYTFSTGCSEWDCLSGRISPPESIREWLYKG